MSNRAYDIVVWGATGFTGRLVVEYLITHHPNTRFAIAGRNEAKCKRVLSELGGDLPIIIADAFDEPSLRDLVRQTKVVCTTVGPYSKYGHLLVELCVDEGTHYCDLTGESPFVRQSIDAHHQRATERGVSIVHACGFDSIPSELGVLITQEFIHQQTGQYAKAVHARTGKMKGGFSGGTIASMINMLDSLPDNPHLPRLFRNPYALNPDPKFKGPDGRDQASVRFESMSNRWTAPFIMAPTNTRIVRRSHAVNGFPYGEDFQYTEAMGFPKGIRGWWMAMSLTTGLGTLMAAMVSSKWLRHQIWTKALPQPGEGPSKEERDNGYFTMHFFAEHEGTLYEGRVSESLDPGYAGTAKMLAEACLCLVHHQNELPVVGGVLTPASAFGMVLVERLKQAGMKFTVQAR